MLNPVERETYLADFGLACTLFINYYTLHSGLEIKFIKKLHKTTGNELSTIFSNSHYYAQTLLCDPVENYKRRPYRILLVTCF